MRRRYVDENSRHTKHASNNMYKMTAMVNNCSTPPLLDYKHRSEVARKAMNDDTKSGSSNMLPRRRKLIRPNLSLNNNDEESVSGCKKISSEAQTELQQEASEAACSFCQKDVETTKCAAGPAPILIPTLKVSGKRRPRPYFDDLQFMQRPYKCARKEVKSSEFGVESTSLTTQAPPPASSVSLPPTPVDINGGCLLTTVPNLQASLHVSQESHELQLKCKRGKLQLSDLVDIAAGAYEEINALCNRQCSIRQEREFTVYTVKQ